MHKNLLLLMVVSGWLASDARGQYFAPADPNCSNPYSGLLQATPAYPTTDASPVVTEWQQPAHSGAGVGPNSEQLPTSASWIVPGDPQPGYVDANLYYEGDVYPQPGTYGSGDAWHWQAVPTGLIYRSYWAGPREPRLGVTLIRTNGGQSYWDPTVGGRVGILRFGNDDPLHPQGWQWDAEAAAIARLTLDEVRDLESVDFRGGTFLTYGTGKWQFKLGYDHLSSHLGDEFLIANPGSLTDRLNYVRDSLVAGVSYYPIPELRLYGEAGYGLNVDGGAEPWEFQFGTELSKAGPTGTAGSPFLALNAHLREEVDFGGDFTAQAGWMWRGVTGQTIRIGAHYLNGMSSQYQWFDKWEEQIGVGVWYDF
jgi:hypothetical protein